LSKRGNSAKIHPGLGFIWGIPVKFIEPCERAHLVGPLVQKFPLDIGGEGHRVVNIHFVIGNHFLTLILLCLSSGIDNCRRVTAPARVGN
jgi:hypothetical protein